MPTYNFTLATATVDATAATGAYFRIPTNAGSDGVTGDHGNGSQIIRVTAVSTDTGAAGNVIILRYDPNQATDKITGYWVGTVTATARRTALAGAANGYVCTVLFSDTNSDKIDILGAGNKPRDVAGTIAAPTIGSEGVDGIQYLIGTSSLGGLTQIMAKVDVTRNI